MKRIHLLFLCLLCCAGATAQSQSLAAALEALNQRQSDYEISFIHNDLEHLQVTASVSGLSIPKAVSRLCKDQPVRVKQKGRDIFVQYKPKADKRYIILSGKVKDNLTHNDLPHSNVRLLTADGVRIDSCEAISHMQYGNNPPIEYADFAFRVPARPAKYIIQASYVGFKTAEMPFELNNIYRREQRRELPPVYMKRETKMLQEVVVTSSKVQFYYKGDTLVFNADAFELAEGSMLDALVRQLPGVELKEGGRIYHNGKYVDALLLNGKDFFRGDHTIMLDNLPAYTVKDIQIYDKWGDQSEFLGQHVMGDNRYVMDVKLKKEYRIGTLANIEAGIGTSSRHSAPDGQVPRIFAGSPLLARLFALRFSDHSRLAAYATANNMNGDGKPGEAGSWDPQRLQDGGQLTQQQAGIDYSVEDRNSKWKADGNVQVTHTDLNRETNTNRQNYLPTGDTYDRIQNTQRDKNLKLNTSHHYYHNFGMWNLDVRPSLNYQKFDNSTYSLASASYQNDSLINRNLQRGLTEGHSIDGEIRLSSTFKFRHSPDWASLDAEASFSDQQEDRYHRQSVQYVAVSQQPPACLNHNYHNHPNRSWKAKAGGTYQINFTSLIRLQLNTGYTHNGSRRESNVFSLTPNPSPRGEGNFTGVGSGYTSEQQDYILPSPLGEGLGVRLPTLGFPSPSYVRNFVTSVAASIRSSLATPCLSTSGTALSSIPPSTVRQVMLGNHSLSFKNTTLWQHFTTPNVQFAAISSQPLTLTNALTALLKLPLQMELNTDLNLYTRTGYTDTRLNTTDLVWNARLTRPFLKGRLLLMVDGFDLLGQLDNVTRIVNAQGRTETYTNVMPRYALLHVVYRLNKQPKEKVQ